LPDDGSAKMNFINFHSRYKTLEFRCFGNINTAEEGMACLSLATEAIQSWYRNETHVFIDNNQWGLGARTAMQESKLAEFVDAHQAHMNAAMANETIINEIKPQLDRLSNQTFNFGA